MNVERATVASFLSQAGSALVLFVGFALFAKLLGGGPFGRFVLVLAIVNVASAVTDLGLQGAVEKRVSEGLGGDVVASALALKAGTLAVVSLALVGARGVVDGYVGANVTAWIVVVLATEQLARVFLSTLKGELRVAEAEVVLLGQRLSFVGVGVGLAVDGGGASELVFAYWSSWLLVLLWTAARFDTPVGRPRRDAVRSLYEFARYNVVSSVVGRRLYGWVDVLVVGLFLTSTHVAAYEMAWRVAGIVVLLPRSIATAVFPRISDWHARELTGEIEGLLPTAFFGAVVFVLPAVGGVAVLAEPLLTVLFGPEFAVASAALVVLTAGKLPESLNVVTGRTLLGVDRPDATVAPAVVLVGSNLGLNLLLVPGFGLVGAAAATSLSVLLSLVVGAHYLFGELSVRLPVRRTGHSILATVATTAAVHAFDRRVGVDGPFEVGAAVCLGVVLYVALLLVSGEVRTSARDLLATVTGR